MYGGRWNRRGVSVLYTSESVSLAAMEVLVNTPIESIPDDLQLLTLSVPEKVQPKQIDSNALPNNWSTWPAPDLLMDSGTEWIESKSSLMLKVPSAVISMEWNILINPGHPDFEMIRIEEIHDFRFDKRLIEPF